MHLWDLFGRTYADRGGRGDLRLDYDHQCKHGRCRQSPAQVCMFGEGPGTQASEGAGTQASERSGTGASEGPDLGTSEGPGLGTSEGAGRGASEGAGTGASEGAGRGASEGPGPGDTRALHMLTVRQQRPSWRGSHAPALHAPAGLKKASVAT